MARGRWVLRVPLLFWVVGTGCWTLFALTLLLVAGDWNPGAEEVALLALLCALSGWGLARWFATPPEPARQVNALVSLIVWCVAIPFVVRGLGAALPSAHGFGTYERILLVPALIALVMVIARRLRLHLVISRFVAVVLVVAFVANDDAGDPDPARVSTATASELRQAALSGRPLGLVRGRRDEAVVDTDRCRSITLDDRRATLIGVAGRRLQVTLRGCWDADGRPASLTVRQRADKGGERGELRTLVPPVHGLRALGTAAAPLFDANPHGDSAVVAITGDAMTVGLAWQSDDLLLRRQREQDSVTERRVEPLVERGSALDVVLATLRPAGDPSATLTRFVPRGQTVAARATATVER